MTPFKDIKTQWSRKNWKRLIVWVRVRILFVFKTETRNFTFKR